MKKSYYGILFVSLFLLSTLPVAFAADYTNPIPDAAVGVESESEISIYDEDAWEDAVGKDMAPDDIWDGDADKEGAKSKIEITDMDEKKLNVYDLVELLFGEKIDDTTQTALEGGAAGAPFNYADLGDTKWEFWWFEYNSWEYTEEEFEAEADDEEEEGVVLQDPKDIEEIYIELNIIVWLMTNMESAGAFQMIYPAKTIMELLLIDKGLPMAKEFDDYVPEFLDNIDKIAKDNDYAGVVPNWPEDKSMKDIEYDEATDTITIEYEKDDSFFMEATVKDDFTIEVILGDTGTASPLNFRTGDTEEDIFFQKQGVAMIPGYEVSLMLGIAAFATIGLIYTVMKKRK